MINDKLDTEEFMKHRSITHVEMVIKFGGMAAKTIQWVKMLQERSKNR